MKDGELQKLIVDIYSLIVSMDEKIDRLERDFIQLKSELTNDSDDGK